MAQGCWLEVLCGSTRPGDDVVAVGAAPELGGWDAGRGLRLSTDAGKFPKWAARAPALAEGSEFKLVISHGRGGGVTWEPFEGNRHWPHGDLRPDDVVRVAYGDVGVEVQHFVVDSTEQSDTSMPVRNRAKRYLSRPTRLEGSSALASPPLFIFGNHGQIHDFYDMGDKAIGEGGFSSVFKARSLSNQNERAIKAIKRSRLADVHAFKREIAIMELMDHPHVIKLFEHYEDQDHVYLVMELCSGGDLFDRIVKEQPFTETSCVNVIKQVLHSVYYMHEKRVCHRDIKAENFLFTTAEAIADTTLKIIDFGLASEFKDGEFLTSKCGTPDYVAPEVLTGRYNQSSDLWACGVLTYIMLCGRPPFVGTNDMQVLWQVKHAEVTVGTTVSQGGRDFIHRLLCRDVLLRYTADKALVDPWLDLVAPQSGDHAVLGPEELRSLHAFRSLNALKKAALQIIAWRFTSPDALKHLTKTFESLDVNGDGTLTLEELSQGFIKAGSPEVEEVFRAIDATGCGHITYTEFLAASIGPQLDRSVEAAFRTLDLDGDGKLSPDDIEGLLSPCHGPTLSRDDSEQVADIIRTISREVDSNGDGDIDLQEFTSMMAGNLKGLASTEAPH